MNVILKNEYLTVEINPEGAEIYSVKSKKGTEFIWNGDKKVWSGHAPILFPICGGLKDNEFTLNDNTYSLEKHGFAKSSLFTVEESNSNKAVFLLKSSDETKKSYPFDFEFRAIFEIIKNTISVSYVVLNLSDYEMYYSVGAHEAYSCPEGIEEYTLKFDRPVTLIHSELDGSYIGDNKVKIIQNSKELPLKEDYFLIDALIFNHIDFDTVHLVHNNGDKKITVKFPNYPNLLLWNIYKSKYICIEPWCGFPDTIHSDKKIENKPDVIKLSSNCTNTVQHEITFED